MAGVPLGVADPAAAGALALAMLVVPAWLRDDSESTVRGETPVVVPIGPKDATVPRATVTFEWTASDAAGSL